MRALIIALVAASCFDSAEAQPPGKWPPDSLVNVQVIPKKTQPVQVWGMMRNIAGALGVSCTFCHVGSDSAPLERIDFATDEKRNKRVARQMMRMVQEVNSRLDTIPARPTATAHCDVHHVSSRCKPTSPSGNDRHRDCDGRRGGFRDPRRTARCAIDTTAATPTTSARCR